MQKQLSLSLVVTSGALHARLLLQHGSFVFFIDLLFKMFYFLNCVFKSRTVFTVAFRALRSSGLDPMLIGLKELISRIKEKLKNRNEKSKSKNPKIRSTIVLHIETRGCFTFLGSTVCFSFLGVHNCVFHFSEEAQLWFTRSTIVLHFSGKHNRVLHTVAQSCFLILLGRHTHKHNCVKTFTRCV